MTWCTVFVVEGSPTCRSPNSHTHLDYIFIFFNTSPSLDPYFSLSPFQSPSHQHPTPPTTAPLHTTLPNRLSSTHTLSSLNMKVLRRSLHKEKDRLVSPSRQSFASSQPPTQPFASLAPHLPGPNPRGLSGPPTMVIRAITSYKAKRIVEISFQKGDFFHVVGEREDAEGEWFEASNPATRARGLVPKFAFEMLGKNSKDQSAPATTPRLSNFGQNVARMSQTAHSPANGPPSAGAPNSAGGQKSQPLYGVVRQLLIFFLCILHHYG